MFVVVFMCCVIQITFVLSTCICFPFEIATYTVWLQVAFQLEDNLIDDVNGSYHVIFQPLTMDWIYGES